MNRKINIALISPNKNAYSETFIQMHKYGLTGNIVYYFDGFLPSKNETDCSYVSPITKKLYSLKKLLKLTKFNVKEQTLLKSFKKNNIDIIVAEYGITAASVLKVCKKLKLPILPIFHGYDASVYDIVYAHKEKYKLLFDYAPKVIAVANSIANNLKNLGCTPSKIIVTPCAPNNSFFEINTNLENQNFLSVGRLVDKKAPYYSILAFSKVLKKFPSARYYIIGDGPLYNTCLNLISYLKLEKNIFLLRKQKPEKVKKYLENSIGFLQHSIIAKNGDEEGTPVSILEASAAGLPIISTKHAGIIDVVVNNKTGFLVEEHDVEAMSIKILELLKSNKLAKEFGEKGREFVKENFSQKKHLSILNNTIKEILE